MASGAESRREHPQTTEENLRVAVATIRFSCTLVDYTRLRCVVLAHRMKEDTGWNTGSAAQTNHYELRN